MNLNKIHIGMKKFMAILAVAFLSFNGVLSAGEKCAGGLGAATVPVARIARTVRVARTVRTAKIAKTVKTARNAPRPIV